MSKRIMLIAAVLVVGAASLVTARQSAGEAEWRKAARAEREKKMRHLDFAINTVADPNGAPQAQFRSGDSVYVHVGATNTGREQTVVVLGDGYHHYFPRLLKDGRPLPYSQKAKERLADTSEPVRVKRSGVKLEPHVEGRIGLLPLSFWYDKLEPGTYHLTLRFALDRTDRKVKTNTVMFEIVR